MKERYIIKSIQYQKTEKSSVSATIEIIVDNELVKKTAIGDGPIDAIFKAIESAISENCELVRYRVEAVSMGSNAMGEAKVTLRFGKRKIYGTGLNFDILEASAYAYINAVNSLHEAKEDDHRHEGDGPF
jgi:2-isopropylmalate synthase